MTDPVHESTVTSRSKYGPGQSPDERAERNRLVTERLSGNKALIETLILNDLAISEVTSNQLVSVTIPSTAAVVTLSLQDVATDAVLSKIIEAVYQFGYSKGERDQIDGQTTALLDAFPNLEVRMLEIAEQAISSDRASRGVDF